MHKQVTNTILQCHCPTGLRWYDSGGPELSVESGLSFLRFFNTWQICLNFKRMWYEWIPHFHCSPPVCLSPFPAVSVAAVVISTFCFLLLSDDWDELRKRKQMRSFIVRHPQSVIIRHCSSPRLHWAVWCLSAHSFSLMTHEFTWGWRFSLFTCAIFLNHRANIPWQQDTNKIQMNVNSARCLWHIQVGNCLLKSLSCWPY